MSKGNKWYYGLSWLVRLIIAAIPGISFIGGVGARITSGKLLNIVLGLIFGWNAFYILDIITTVILNRLFFS